jgi:hypothetical protein
MMTDKEIAVRLAIARDIWSSCAINDIERGDYWSASKSARASVHIIHHIINSINWED